MGFRMSISAPSARPKWLPVQGMFRKSANIDGLPLMGPTPPITGRLSQSTLHKVFLGMLVTVFIFYCTLMMLIMQHNEKSILDTEGKWGPTMAASHQVLRDHIQQLVEQRRQQTEEDRKERHIPNSEIQISRHVEVDPSVEKHIVPFSDMEEVDIHDMKPPDVLKQSKNQKSEATSPPVRSDENHIADNITKKPVVSPEANR